MRALLMYAHSLIVAEEDLLDKVSLPSNNGILRSVLIKEWISGNMMSYYEMARDSDLLTWGNLLLHRKRQLQRRLGQFSVDNILTTGLPQEEADRNYSAS